MNRFPFIVGLAFLMSLLSMAQDELLPKGAYGTTIHGGIEAGERKAYSLEGRRGQVLKVHLVTKGVEKGATLDLIDSDGDSVLGELANLTKVDAVNLVLPKEDRYQLHVKAGEETCSYILEVTLEDADEEARRPDSRPVVKRTK